MRRPLTEEEKRYIVRRKEAGATLAEIAKELECSVWTVQKWWQRHRRHERPRPRGRPRKGALSTFPEAVRVEAKRFHALS